MLSILIVSENFFLFKFGIKSDFVTQYLVDIHAPILQTTTGFKGKQGKYGK